MITCEGFYSGGGFSHRDYECKKYSIRIRYAKMPTEKASHNFAKGLINHYEPGLKKVEKQLAELTSKQNIVLRELQKENVKFSSIDINDLNFMFTLVKEHHSRLLTMKKDMIGVAEKAAKLKKRALQLQEHRQKLALENAHYREAQLRREQELIAKPDSSFKPL